jgi:hypothetical protein
MEQLHHACHPAAYEKPLDERINADKMYANTAREKILPVFENKTSLLPV